MEFASFARRFLIPAPIVSLLCWLKFGARVSPRAEVELGPGLRLGRGVNISSFTKVKASGPMIVGDHTSIATGCFIGAGSGGLHIGDNCLIGPNCVIITSEYRDTQLGVPLRLQGHVSRGTRIGRNVLVGANSVILDGAQVGDEVIVSAGSVVSGRIPDAVVVAGNPARVVFKRR
jgi:acetyltransferase-like isoleucine patch superfamily enzyme